MALSLATLNQKDRLSTKRNITTGPKSATAQSSSKVVEVAPQLLQDRWIKTRAQGVLPHTSTWELCSALIKMGYMVEACVVEGLLRIQMKHIRTVTSYTLQGP